MTQDQLQKFFLEKKEKAKPLDINWEAKRDTWIKAVKDFYRLITDEYLKAVKDDVEITYSEKLVQENFIGEYRISECILCVGEEQVIFSPKGANVAGASGRIDVQGDRGEAMLVWQAEGGWNFSGIANADYSPRASDRRLLHRYAPRHYAAMKRRSLSNLFSNEEQDLDKIWEWYELQRALIGEEKVRVLEAFARTDGIMVARYIGKTEEELEVYFSYHITELKYMTMLGMLASTKAALRIDFIVRVKNRNKDEVSRKFRRTFKNRGINRIRLEEDILDIWKEHATNPGVNIAIADFKGALNLRNWLAHGRYWRPKIGRADGYIPADVFDICRDLLMATGLLSIA